MKFRHNCSLFIIFRSNVGMAENSLNICFDIVLDDQKHENSTRRGVLDRILSPMFQYVSLKAVRQFFKNKIKTIVQMIEAKLVKVLCFIRFINKHPIAS